MSKVFAPIRRAADKLASHQQKYYTKITGSETAGKRGRMVTEAFGAPFLSRTQGGKTEREIGTALGDPADIFGGKSDMQAEAAAEEEAARIAAIPPPRPLPDEEEIRRNRKKNKARSRSTGRASTILSDEGGDYLGAA